MNLVLVAALGFLSVSPNIHGRICQDACTELGISANSASKIVDANREQDILEATINLRPGQPWFKPNSHYRPEHHFDRNEGDSDRDSFTRGAAYFRTRRQAAVDALKNHDAKAALKALGQASHAIQDLYSHSNIVDSKPLQGAIDEALETGSFQGGLRLTGYSRKTGGVIAGDDYSHEAHCKDGTLETPLGKKPQGESAVMLDGRTKFDIAKDLAEKATAALFRWVKTQAGVDAQQIFKPTL